MKCEGWYAVGLPGIISLILKELQGEKGAIFPLVPEMVPTPRWVEWREKKYFPPPPLFAGWEVNE